LRVSLQAAGRFRVQFHVPLNFIGGDGSLLLTLVRDGFQLKRNRPAVFESRFMPAAATRRATDDLAYAGNEQAREIVACEPRSPHPFIYVKASEFILESACLAAV
jgi:hypothetical protein